jgi:plasmid stability protein
MRLLYEALVVAAIFCVGPALASENSTLKKFDLQEIIDELKDRDLSAYEIRSIKSLVRLDVVDLNAVASAEEREILDEALRSTETGWAMVQTAILGNDLVMIELERQSVQLRRVVAATLSEDGVVTIYIR